MADNDKKTFKSALNDASNVGVKPGQKVMFTIDVAPPEAPPAGQT